MPTDWQFATRNAWSPADAELLAQLYTGTRLSFTQLGERLGRSREAVRHQAPPGSIGPIFWRFPTSF